MKQRFRSGGLAAWSIHHPIGIIMLALTVVVLGLFSLQRLSIDLLPHIIYPEVRVRINDPGVPAEIMEDRVTRQLEEQLAITEGAIQVQSNTTEGNSSVDLSFPYGTDIDLALRDASTRLDRAKRFLPDTIEPPVIYKRDPAQIPVMELVLSSNELDAVELRTWADYTFSRWFLTLPGVAAIEVGGGLQREIQILPDQDILASVGLTLQDLADIIQRNNTDSAGGRLMSPSSEISTRTRGRFESVEELRNLPLWNASTKGINDVLRLRDVAEVLDSHEDERLRVRLNDRPGVKVSVQKLPQANTVSVVDEVQHRLQQLETQKLMPADVSVTTVDDQSVYVRHALNNASMAAVSGALLAMLVIYLFLGNMVRTLIIGSAIPLGILVTFTIMDITGLTLNIMTLGGLALGMGLLIDSTIVMLENITRHQHDSGSADDNAITAAAEVNSPIVASTATNLAAILPFLFIGGLTGLLFRELIITITSAMLAALLVALTLVPALGAKIKKEKENKSLFNNLVNKLKVKYRSVVERIVLCPTPIVVIFLLAFIPAVLGIMNKGFIFLPTMDEGNVNISIRGDAGMNLDEMDSTVEQVESLLLKQPEVLTVFSTVGGRIFGRSEYESSDSSSLKVKLVPLDNRSISSEDWVKKMDAAIKKLNLTGYKIRLNVQGVRGIRLSSGDNDVSLRIQGQDIETLTGLATEMVEKIRDLPGLRNVEHSYEGLNEELNVHIDRQRAADLGVNIDSLGQALRIALDGSIISDYIEGDRQFDVRMRLPRNLSDTPARLGNLLVGQHNGRPVRLHEVANISRGPAPSAIKHDQQQRIVEITAALDANTSLEDVNGEIQQALKDFKLPDGYYLYDGGASTTLSSAQQSNWMLLALAIFLVLVVMAVQYESLRNPLIILSSIPFALIGVSLGLWSGGLLISTPVYLGMIMLAGIVVNNSIVLVEQIEIEREKGSSVAESISLAASQRLRPILMTTLTTVFGMLPLAMGLGEGAEMLQPLAYVIVWGLSFSTLVSLVLVPAVYRLIHQPGRVIT